MPVNDATLAFLTEMGESGIKPIHESTPEEVRGLTAGLKDLYGEGPEVARAESVSIPVADGEITLRVLVPEGTPRAVIVYYHGGGWVIGALPEFETLGRKLAVATQCAVVIPDYRMAPEYRYPIAVDDSYAALEWVADNVADIAGADVAIIVAGDSAGGNLSAVMSQRARDRNGPRIALQVLIYPVTDADLDNASYTNPEYQLMLQRDSMIWFWDHYLPDIERRSEPDASPLQATDLSGLPPALVVIAEYDVLRDEGEAYARRLGEAGVPVTTHLHEGSMHGFCTLLMLPGHEEVFGLINTAMDAHLPTTTS